MVPAVVACLSLQIVPFLQLRKEAQQSGCLREAPTSVQSLHGAVEYSIQNPAAAAGAESSGSSLPALQALGPSPFQAPPYLRPRRDSAAVLWEFVPRILEVYFGAPTRLGQGGPPFEGGGAPLAASPEQLLAGRFPLRALSVVDFVDLTRVFTSCMCSRMCPLLPLCC